MPDPEVAEFASGGSPGARYHVVVVDEERRLEAGLRALLVHALPVMAEHLASCPAAVDAAPDRGE